MTLIDAAVAVAVILACGAFEHYYGRREKPQA